MWYVNFKKTRCKSWYACARVCPVNAIKFKNEQAQILKDRCIVCNECSKACPQKNSILKSEVSKIKFYICWGNCYRNKSCIRTIQSLCRFGRWWKLLHKFLPNYKQLNWKALPSVYKKSNTCSISFSMSHSTYEKQIPYWY